MSQKNLLISWQTFEAIKFYANLDKQLVCLRARTQTETVSIVYTSALICECILRVRTTSNYTRGASTRSNTRLIKSHHKTLSTYIAAFLLHYLHFFSPFVWNEGARENVCDLSLRHRLENVMRQISKQWKLFQFSHIRVRDEYFIAEAFLQEKWIFLSSDARTVQQSARM